MLLLRIGNEVEDEKDREGERDASRVKENKRECKEMRKRHATLENIWIIELCICNFQHNIDFVLPEFDALKNGLYFRRR